MANADGVVTDADMRAAQTALDTLLAAKPVHLPAAMRAEWRGMLAQILADVRTAGYLEGVQRGRQEAAHVVLDALRDEGLAPMPTSAPQDGW